MSGLKGIRSIEDFELKDQRVFLRLDLNVPIKNGKITDETRILATLPTIRYAMEKGAKLILASHLGRPKSAEDRGDNSLEPVGARLAELLDADVQLIEDPAGEAPKALLHVLHPGQIILLENLRFDKREEANSDELASRWASYTDIYINDAFGASHRAHASIVALPKQIKKKGVGFLMKKEIEMLDRIVYKPEHPFVAVLGGAKVSDKIGVLNQLLDKADSILVGGAMAYTFLASQGVTVGKSRVEKDKVNLAKDLILRMEARGKRIFLPVDHVVAKELKEGVASKIVTQIPSDEMGLDIGPQTAQIFEAEIQKARTVFWNGPMGAFEIAPFEKGTFQVAQALTKCTGATIVGGGDSVSAINKSGLADKVTHISTGGGASLEYLQGDQLPGLEAVRETRPLS